MKKTCFCCIHCHPWSYPETREDPGDEGWDCDREVDVPENLWDESGGMRIDEACEYVAERCPFYTDTTERCVVCDVDMGATRTIDRKNWQSPLFGDVVVVCDGCKPGFIEREQQARKEYDEIFDL